MSDSSNILEREARFAESNGWLAGFCVTPTDGFQPGPVSGDAITRRRAADAAATRPKIPGLTDTAPMPYGYRRWNGAVWPNIQVDAYNRELDRIRSRHDAGLNVQHLVDGLYNLANGFDAMGKPYTHTGFECGAL
jgi:hypothetical protein